MPAAISRSRRLATAARWPVGVLLTSWRYMWRTAPMRRRELEGDPATDAPPALPADFSRDDVQAPADGAGPLFHRRYAVRVRDAELGPEALVAKMRDDLDAFAPSEFASFQRVGGEGRLEAGDEYRVRMPGPWDGPVRVVEADATSFRLATLVGHLEAGQIIFRASGDLEFTIESWARSGDRLVNLLYTHARMAKEIQLHMWVSVLERVVEHSGGRRAGLIEIETRRVEARDPRLDRLRDLAFNFDRAELGSDGWNRDERLTKLPGEPPGSPVPDGPWEIARRLMRGYEFADPSIVRASYDRRAPLEGRDMLLQVRFHGLRFYAGCRVTDVYERDEDVEGRPAHVWGWSYATLQGHFEQGEMSWEVVKWPDTGEVAFRVRARSRRSHDRGPFVRLGFWLFGPREQQRFYDATGVRLRRLVEEALEDGSPEAIRRAAKHETAGPSPGDDDVHDALARNAAREP